MNGPSITDADTLTVLLFSTRLFFLPFAPARIIPLFSIFYYIRICIIYIHPGCLLHPDKGSDKETLQRFIHKYYHYAAGPIRSDIIILHETMPAAQFIDTMLSALFQLTQCSRRHIACTMLPAPFRTHNTSGVILHVQYFRRHFT